MLPEDKKMLVTLVKSYPPAEVLSELVSAFIQQRDELSDLGIKDKAIQFSEVADLIGEIRDVLRENEY